MEYQRQIHQRRQMLEKGNWLRNQPLIHVQNQSILLKPTEQLYIDSILLDNGEIAYNIKLQKQLT